MTKRAFDRYAHSPIFWLLVGFIFIVSAGLAGTMDRQNAEARGETEVTR
jgi:hypothetical protein